MIRTLENVGLRHLETSLETALATYGIGSEQDLLNLAEAFSSDPQTAGNELARAGVRGKDVVALSKGLQRLLADTAPALAVAAAPAAAAPAPAGRIKGAATAVALTAGAVGAVIAVHATRRYFFPVNVKVDVPLSTAQPGLFSAAFVALEMVFTKEIVEKVVDKSFDLWGEGLPKVVQLVGHVAVCSLAVYLVDAKPGSTIMSFTLASDEPAPLESLQAALSDDSSNAILRQLLASAINSALVEQQAAAEKTLSPAPAAGAEPADSTPAPPVELQELTFPPGAAVTGQEGLRDGLRGLLVESLQATEKFMGRGDPRTVAVRQEVEALPPREEEPVPPA